ncbi:GspE/PulE family protein [Niveibacterium sp. SC-1]|uniref:GspE/PulE family protein n=1 Tax=Niveibacterium sp. SC-1 TaxID=3135646 RepID=UPI0031200F07
MSAGPADRPPLGQQLLAQGLISEDQLRIALMEQARGQHTLGKLLVQLGFLSEATLRDALSHNLGAQSVDLAHALVDPAALRMVAEPIARRHRLLPLSYDEARRTLLVAMADTGDIVALDKLRSSLAADVSVAQVLAGESEIVRAIDQHYGHVLSIDGILGEIEAGRGALLQGSAGGDPNGQPVVRLVDALLVDAVKRGASDIHFEPEAAFLRVRYRIDGLLRQIRALHRSHWAAMSVRLKVMAKLNIAENRAPQDGRISLHVSGREIDFRIATQPTIHGENIVLRVLDRQRGIVPLEDLGLTRAQLDGLTRLIARPEGLLLVTGPTGSGKTTTLYSILQHLSHEGINVMTLEDPVEYPMPLLRQTSVSEAVKLDFANGVRAMMRQDPDVILVGEIRDADTASMALRAAMTGHQVFSTLHTRSALGVVPRLRDLGVKPDVMEGNIMGAIGQRLVRRLCERCRHPRAASETEHRLTGCAEVYEAPGCSHCEFRGFRGRSAIMELLRFDADLDGLVARGASGRELDEAARAKGFISLAEDGLRRVADGTTSLAELARVVDLSDRIF